MINETFGQNPENGGTPITESKGININKLNLGKLAYKSPKSLTLFVPLIL